MKKGLVILLLGAIYAPVGAAPLFPQPAPAWASDAVRSLVEKGLVHGFADGTFKGDRAMSRWEVAALLARCLAVPADSLARSEVEQLRRLAEALRPELEALGVRLENLERQADQLDQRVTELERITFYGDFSTRVAVQNFRNLGSSQSDPNSPVLNYDRHTFVGGGAAVDFNPNVFGVYSLADLKSGNLQESGTGVTSRLNLGVKARLSDDLSGGVEVSAFSAQGNTAVNAYYGVSAPYQSNFFTSIRTVHGDSSVLPDNNTPFSRATLDHIWLRHGPSDTALTLGAFSGSTFDGLVYTPQVNPASFGPRYLDGFGFQLRGNRVELNSDLTLSYEVMATRLADDNAGAPLQGESDPSGYFNHAEGVSLGLDFADHRGAARVNFLHAANDSSNGSLGIGLVSEVNQLTTINPWVNPNGFYRTQLGSGSATAGIGSTSDKRPVPQVGNLDGSSLAGTPAVGNLGPQDQTGYGASLSYDFDAWLRPRVFGEVAQTIYTPQKNSGYSARGNAGRVGAGLSIPLTLRPGLTDPASAQPQDFLALHVQAEYVDVSPFYDPFVLQMPRISERFYNLYVFPNMDRAANLYPLHDTSVYPQNRTGGRLKVTWEFAPEGALEVRYGHFQQKETSLQDVRYSVGALGPGTPDSLILGHSPGFVDPVFPAFAVQTFAPSGGNLLGRVLENPRGRVDSWDVRAHHRWESGWGVSGEFQHQQFSRDSGLSSPAGADVNYVNFSYQRASLKLHYDVSADLGVQVGYDRMDLRGHYDPYGVYAPYGVSVGQSHFDNLNVTQHEPFVGMNWKIAENIQFDGELRFLTNVDHVAAGVFPTPAQPGLNLVYNPQYSAHPFNWGGYRLNTGFNFRF